MEKRKKLGYGTNQTSNPRRPTQATYLCTTHLGSKERFEVYNKEKILHEEKQPPQRKSVTQK